MSLPGLRPLIVLAILGTFAFAQDDIEVPDGFIVETMCEGFDGAVTMDVARDGRGAHGERRAAAR